MQNNTIIRSSKIDDLASKMARLGIRDQDIIEKFIRSSGPGGQNVNKTSTSVYLKHIPTGTEVKFSRERSQSLNRFLGKRLLINKLETLILGKESEERKRIEKIKRQKRKRSKRAKAKMLDDKRHMSYKKQNRGKVSFDTQ
jgi:peptide chain release factor